MRRAIATLERALPVFGAPVYVRKQIVHNRYVVASLTKRGAIFVNAGSEIFSAHGVSAAGCTNA